jgi:hypothetical protein
MWGLFRRSKLLGSEDEYFQIECFRWLLTHFGGEVFFRKTALILPTNDFFPDEVSSGDEAVRATFDQVLLHANMQDWPVTLIAQDEDPDIVVGEAMLLQNVQRNPQGTFSVNAENEVTISYNPALIANPAAMVATFAHELAHYLTATAPQAPPGGWENWEFATDIAATFMGFGIFMANSAFSFRQYSGGGSIGWQAARSGYLSEAEHSYALAIFLLLKEIDPRQAFPHCDRNICSHLKRALAELRGSDSLEALKKVELLDMPNGKRN